MLGFSEAWLAKHSPLFEPDALQTRLSFLLAFSRAGANIFVTKWPLFRYFCNKTPQIDFGESTRTPQRRSGDSFCLFEPGLLLTPVAGRRDPKLMCSGVSLNLKSFVLGVSLKPFVLGVSVKTA